MKMVKRLTYFIMYIDIPLYARLEIIDFVIVYISKLFVNTLQKMQELKLKTVQHLFLNKARRNCNL